MTDLRGLAAITAKDLRQRLRDGSAVVFGVIVPLGLAMIFGLVLPGVGDEEVSLEVGVVDRDGGQLAAAFRDRLGRIDVVSGVEELPDPAAARRAVDGGGLAAVYVLPEGFSDAARGGRSELDVVVDPDAAIDRLVAVSIAESFARRVDTAAVAVAAVAATGGGPPDRETIGAIARTAAERGPAVTLEQGVSDDDQLDPTTYLAAGMAVFFLFFTVNFGVISLLEEREQGTLARLRATPLRSGVVTAAKVLTSVALGVLSMTVLVVATSLLLGARWGDPLGVALLVLAGVLAASAVVAVVGSVARTAEQANAWMAIVAIVLGMLGGSFFPLGGAPGWLLRLQLVSPHHWFLRGLGELAGGGGPADALPAVAALLAFGAGAGVVAVLLRRRGLA